MDSSATQESQHAEPQRRCICCRSNGKKISLLRFVVFQNVLCFDLRHKLPGRGFYVCAQHHCLQKAFESGFKRITKHDSKELAADVDGFIADILPALKKRYSEFLLAGFQSHQLLLGADSVEHAASSDELACYILATDASPSTRQKYESNANRKKLPCFGIFDRATYGRLFGKSDKVVMGWLPGHLYDEFSALENAIRRFENSQEIEENR